MKTYIEKLKNRLEWTNCPDEKNKIINILKHEKDTCNRILVEYSERRARSWVEFTKVSDNESETINEITKILNSVNKNNENSNLN